MREATRADLMEYRLKHLASFVFLMAACDQTLLAAEEFHPTLKKRALI
tara:strand:+ start:207 stop:350 length:144 start_codon:yes stop_codon:yes gene_type:complete